MSITLRLVEFRSMKYRGPLELRVENQIICYKCGECLRVPTFTGFCDIILAGISATMRHSAEKIHTKESFLSKRANMFK